MTLWDKEKAWQEGHSGKQLYLPKIVPACLKPIKHICLLSHVLEASKFW
jgi:hypothetical protein